MNWYDALKVLVKDIAEGRSGQVGGIQVSPPDNRSTVLMTVGVGRIAIQGVVGPDYSFTAEQSDEAVATYVAAVEGSA